MEDLKRLAQVRDNAAMDLLLTLRMVDTDARIADHIAAENLKSYWANQNAGSE